MKNEESEILVEVGKSIQCVGRREEKFNVSLGGRGEGHERGRDEVYSSGRIEGTIFLEKDKQ